MTGPAPGKIAFQNVAVAPEPRRAAPAPEPDRVAEREREDSLRAALRDAQEFKAKLESESRARREAELRLRRHERGATAGLPPELSARLRGETDEEIDADIDLLRPFVPGAYRPQLAPNPHQGSRSPQPAPSLASGRDRYQAKRGA